MKRRLIVSAALVAILSHPAARPAVAADAGVPAAPEDGGPRNWQVTGVTGALNLMVTGTAGSAPNPPAIHTSRKLPAKGALSRSGCGVPPSEGKGTVTKRRLHGRSQ